MNNFTKFLTASLLGLSISSFAQEKIEDIKNPREIKPVIDIEATEVKSQGRTGTCWSFSTTSFVESELIRAGKGTHSISEMFNVRNVYPSKADVYVRNQGIAQFGEGSLAHDVINSIEKFGLVPDEVYIGRSFGEIYNHKEMSTILKKILTGVIENKGGSLSPRWKEAFNAVLDVYMGKAPEEFEYEGKKYTPKSFAKSLGFSADNYVSITSFTHQPYYKPFILQVPDNFSDGSFYNTPLDEFVEIIDNALEEGYTIALDADVSELGFSAKHGLAILPPKSENSLSEKERKELFTVNTKEISVTPENRQEAYNNYETTDDHLMHIVGTGLDKFGNRYYKVKNSWGTKGRGFEGHVYMSLPYIKMKTIAILLHKDALTKNVKKKLNIK